MLIKEGSAFFILHSFDRMDRKGEAHKKIEFIRRTYCPSSYKINTTYYWYIISRNGLCTD